ncbi:MAG: LPS export ABC transporter periplasmic protein LptC [Methylococcaceae bacterium]|nr:LPS export ABC transporter periplasmic protein LptC [Methylococcaceae bacterium]
MTLQDYKPYAYLGVLAVLSAWLADLAQLGQSYQTVVPAHSPDYFSEGYSKWEMDTLGVLKNSLMSTQLTHYSDDGVTQLVNPVMFFYNKKSPPWVVKSAAGVLSGDGKQLLLTDKVAIVREKAQGVQPLTINTSVLTVYPETHYAETRASAELVSPPNRTTGVGMTLTFAQPVHLQLLAHVKGKYETK